MKDKIRIMRLEVPSWEDTDLAGQMGYNNLFASLGFLQHGAIPVIIHPPPFTVQAPQGWRMIGYHHAHATYGQFDSP